MTSVNASSLQVTRPEPTVPPRRARGPALDLRCGSCGYGIATETAPELCPMCGTAAWEPAPWQPFSRPEARVLAR